jgi:PAS domain S-box-containing protein
MPSKLSYQQLQERINELEEKLYFRDKVKDSLMENTEDYGFVLTNINGDNSKIIDCNKGFEKIYKSTKDKLKNQPVSSILPKEFTQHIPHNSEEYTPEANNHQIEKELTFSTPDGRKFSAHVVFLPVLSKNNEIQAMEIFIYPKHTTQEREYPKESHKLFSAFTEELPSAIFIKDSNLRTIYVNNFIINEFEGDKWMHKTNQEAFDKETADILDQNDREVLEKGEQEFTEILIDKKGNKRYFKSYKFPIERKHKAPLIGGIGIDITEQVETKRVLNESENRFAKLFNSTNIGIAIVDLDFTIIDSNSGYSQMIGYKREEIIGRKLWEFTHPEVLEENKNKQKQLARGEIESYQMEKKFIHKDGSIIYGLLDANLIRDTEGNPSYFIGQVVDITKRKKIELSEKENKRMLETLVSNLPGMAYRCVNTKDWRMVYLSKGCERLTGYKQEDLIDNYKLSFADLIHKDDQEYVWESVQGAIEKQIPFEIEYRLITAENKERWMWEKGQFVGEGKMGVTYLEGFIMDITETKEANKALRESEENYRILAETARDIICIHDLEGTIQYINNAGAKYLGLKADEIKGRKVDEFIKSTEEQKKVLYRKEKRKYGNSRKFLYESTISSINGKDIPLEISSSPITHKGKTSSVLLVGRDIKERKEAEEKLRQNEAWYRILFETTGTATFIFGDNKVIIRCNKEFEQLSGYTREEIEGKMLWSDFIHQDDLPRMQRYHELRTQNSAKPPNVYEFKFLDKNRELKFIRITINKIKGTEFRVASFADLTSLITTQEALRISEERLKLAIEGIGLGLWDWNLSTGEVFFNENWSTMLGYDPSEIEYHEGTWKKLVHPDDWPEVKNELNRHLEGETNMYFTEHRLKTRTGEYLWISDRGTVVERDKAGNPKRMVGIHNDISQRKEAEFKLKNWNKELEKTVKERTAQLEETNKELESFSYSVSHDLKAPLRAITNFIKILREECVHIVNEEQLKYLDIIQSNAEKMNTLITDLLSFSKLGRKSLNLQNIKTIKLVREAYQEQVKDPGYSNHEFILKPLSNLYADVSMMRIVFNNLISNALKFSAYSNNPMIEIGETMIDNKRTIYVKDNGMGFDMKYVNKVFGAFQRLHSEDEYKGTGIGLSLVQRIINKHGGRIWVESKLGEGTIFYFYISPVEKN